MKRWSKRGSVAAHERMAQLRTRKLRHERSALITEWTALTRRDGREWTEVQRVRLPFGMGGHDGRPTSNDAAESVFMAHRDASIAPPVPLSVGYARDVARRITAALDAYEART